MDATPWQASPRGAPLLSRSGRRAYRRFGAIGGWPPFIPFARATLGGGAIFGKIQCEPLLPIASTSEIIVGEEGQAWSGIATVGRMEEWPPWRPTAGEQARLGPLPAFVTGGPQNPMGARGLYLYLGGKDSQYRIHGTNQPEYIGRARSSGCIRLTNEDVIDLYNRVKVGATVVVLGPTNRYMSSGPHRVDTPNT